MLGLMIPFGFTPAGYVRFANVPKNTNELNHQTQRQKDVLTEEVDENSLNFHWLFCVIFWQPHRRSLGNHKLLSSQKHSFNLDDFLLNE